MDMMQQFVKDKGVKISREFARLKTCAALFWIQ
jgi:hypothetical protein